VYSSGVEKSVDAPEHGNRAAAEGRLMLKVLWFTNVVLPEAAKAIGLPVFLKAGWLEGYLAALRRTGDVRVTAVTHSGSVNRTTEIEVEDVHHIILPAAAMDVTAPPTDSAVKEYRELVHSLSPDIVHYHGSECHYGLLTARGHITAPSVLSIQGLLTECAEVYHGGLSVHELVRAHTLREIYHRGGILGGRRQFARRALVEREILRGMEHVIGRTLWDRAHVREINPAAQYHHCDELLRPAFYSTIRTPGLFRRFSIYASSASYPLKGFHFLLKAVALLKKDFPEITVRIPDNQPNRSAATSGYCRLIHSMIRELDLSGRIEWLGPLDAAGVSGVLSQSHVFVASSLVENLCNALAEAMLVGVPSIASYAGGMATTLRDRETGLFFPVGDHALLAESIRLLFTDDDLAGRLALNARAVAVERHDYAAVGANLVAIYQSIVRGSQPA
jgi:glycosyltransferase involved in cell wall biosynthesis